tara:strand:- start:708 stop:1049 length:342 start_codon:yes stop_codon:yes gene_type:complete
VEGVWFTIVVPITITQGVIKLPGAWIVRLVLFKHKEQLILVLLVAFLVVFVDVTIKAKKLIDTLDIDTYGVGHQRRRIGFWIRLTKCRKVNRVDFVLETLHPSFEILGIASFC